MQSNNSSSFHSLDNIQHQASTNQEVAGHSANIAMAATQSEKNNNSQLPNITIEF